jgi:hypothetical protein
MKWFKKKKEIKEVIQLPEPKQLITALIQLGDDFAEVVGCIDADDPAYIIHPWQNKTGIGRSKIISWKPIDVVTNKTIKSAIAQDETLQRTVEGCLNLCSTAGLQCHDCESARPHHHFYFAKSSTARGFEVVSYPTLNIAHWQHFLENDDEYFIDWVKPEYYIKNEEQKGE